MGLMAVDKELLREALRLLEAAENTATSAMGMRSLINGARALLTKALDDREAV